VPTLGVGTISTKESLVVIGLHANSLFYYTKQTVLRATIAYNWRPKKEYSVLFPMAKFISCCPVALEQKVLLVAANQLTDPNALAHAPTHTLAWIQESESCVLMMHGRQVLKYGSRFNDRNGYLTSLTDAYREARQLAEYYELDQDSFESIIVSVRFIRIPVFQIQDSNVRFSWRQTYRQYELLDQTWQAFDTNKHPLLIRRETLADNVTAWSSKLHMHNSRDTLHNFRERWDFSKPSRRRYTAAANRFATSLA